MAKRRKAKAKKATNVSQDSLTSKLPLPNTVPNLEPRSSKKTSRKRKPLAPLSKSQVNTQLLKPQTALDKTSSAMSRHHYGSKASALRLEKVGFDPRVTDLTSHLDYFEEWSKMAAIEGHKPLIDHGDIGPAGPKKRYMTIVSYIFLFPQQLISHS